DIDFDLSADLPPTSRVASPMPTPPLPFPRIEPPNPSRHNETPPPLPPMPDMSALDPESIRLSLTDLDDVRVTKDPLPSEQLSRAGIMLPRSGKQPTQPPLDKPIAKPPIKEMPLEEMTANLERATTREAATDAVLSYVATRWTAGLVLAIRDRTAIGYRGHGVEAPESGVVSLGSPSTGQRAVQTPRVSVEAPNGVGQSALMHALNGTRHPTAAPVVVNGQAVAVIAVSEPHAGPEARDSAAADLATIAEALGSAYKRIMSR